MKLIVGLGNPGTKYQNTRHNVGFWVVDAWAAYENITFIVDKKFKAEIAKLNNDLRLIKPQTFMNLSGEAVGTLCKYFQVSPAEVLVIHDEIDLPSGVARVKFGGGNAGHNGLKSISQYLGTNDFWRLRLGVGRPINIEHEVSDFVLGKPDENDEGLIIEIIDDILELSEKIIGGKIEEVKQFFHLREKKLEKN